MNCVGSENRLIDCVPENITGTCNSTDVVVECYPSKITAMTVVFL